MSLIKKVFFYTTILAINVFLLESVGCAYLKFSKHEKVENFNIWDFTERVNDERIITVKKNYTYKYSDTATWGVQTSEIGTRAPPLLKFEGSSINKPVFLFIGDSVPFGWGSHSENSMPYILSNKLPSYQIINGAVPSYSLLQAVKRFEYEFSKINNIEYIYIQIYDPVSQYALNGSNWSETDNWSTFSDKQFNGCKFFDSTIYNWFYQNSKFIYFVNKLYRDFSRCWKYSPPNELSDVRLKNHIKKQLYLLKQHKNKTTKVIVAPVTPSFEGLADLNQDYIETLSKVNGSLKDVSDELGFIFIDTQKLLDKQEYFIDRCCHLSKAGADQVANSLVNMIDADQFLTTSSRKNKF